MEDEPRKISYIGPAASIAGPVFGDYREHKLDWYEPLEEHQIYQEIEDFWKERVSAPSHHWTITSETPSRKPADQK